jgi:hypothetical protein
MTRRRASPADPTGDRAYPELALEILLAVLDSLPEREARVIALRFGLLDGQPKTLDEIGRVYGVSRERIRRIESKTMTKLRHRSRSQVLLPLEDYVQMPEHIRERMMRQIREQFGEPIGSVGQDPLIYCDKHGWTDPDYASRQVCKCCPCPVGPVWQGRPRAYCSDACRQTAYRARQKERKARAAKSAPRAKRASTC